MESRIAKVSFYTSRFFFPNKSWNHAVEDKRAWWTRKVPRTKYAISAEKNVVSSLHVGVLWSGDNKTSIIAVTALDRPFSIWDTYVLLFDTIKSSIDTVERAISSVHKNALSRWMNLNTVDRSTLIQTGSKHLNYNNSWILANISPWKVRWYSNIHIWSQHYPYA